MLLSGFSLSALHTASYRSNGSSLPNPWAFRQWAGAVRWDTQRYYGAGTAGYWLSVQGGWIDRVMIGSAIFGRIDMSTRIVSASLALACVLGSPSTLAWKNVDGVIKFEGNETRHCDAWALDASAVMHARQFNQTPVYVRDKSGEPSEETLKMREILAQQVLAYPRRETPEEMLRDSDEFTRAVWLQCIRAYVKSTPSSS